MTTNTLLPLFITASLAVLLVAGFLTNPDPTTAVNPVPCPTLVPAATATPDGGPTYTATPTYTPCLIKLTSTPTITPTPTPPETAISLRVNVSQQTSCPGGPQPGQVCVPIGDKFDVIAVADAIPASGYILAQAFIAYDNQGLVNKNAGVALWPDCAAPTFLTTDDVANNAASAGCLTGIVPPFPVSLHLGDLFSFSLTCTNVPNSSDIQLLPSSDPIVGPKGTVFIDPDNLVVDAALTGISVNCVSPPPEFPDFDGDGCTWDQEVGSNETLGGLRSDANPWDFYDVAGSPGPPQNGAPDGIIDLPNDILGVIQHHPAGDLGYDAQFDRGPWTGPNSWNETQGPDGIIDLPNDILGVILQFNHSCQ